MNIAGFDEGLYKPFMHALYDTIGLNYADLRRPDPRIRKMIDAALGDAETVLNVGAGAGSYEPDGRRITAVEPSREMIAQRKASDATVIQGYAEDLPFEDNAFDAAMAVLTIHHWTDKKRGVAEMRRVTRNRIVFLTYDPSFRDLWLFDYFPKLAALDEGKMPPIEDFESWLGPVTVSPVLVPYNCTDGFVAAYWRRPAAYLDEKVRAAMSPFWAMGDISEELGRLKSDLESGTWDARYGGLVGLDALDCGYRIIESVLQS